jgi:hypothetical protein
MRTWLIHFRVKIRHNHRPNQRISCNSNGRSPYDLGPFWVCALPGLKHCKNKYNFPLYRSRDELFSRSVPCLAFSSEMRGNFAIATGCRVMNSARFCWTGCTARLVHIVMTANRWINHVLIKTLDKITFWRVNIFAYILFLKHTINKLVYFL